MQILFQIFTGDLTEQSLTESQEILPKLQKARERGQLAGVLCGWTLDAAFYQRLLDMVHSWGAPVYLKLPVFSELENYKDFDPMLDWKGQPVQPYRLNPQESFRFRCPQSSRNRQTIVDLYDQQFSMHPFDGVFLDRIRYPSFLSGLAGMGGCFCLACREQLERRGVSVSQAERRLRLWQEGEAPHLTAYEGGRWTLDDSLLDRLFTVKAQIIEDGLQEVTRAFHERGLKVGFDLFMPALGYFCGQDAQRLRQIADFVKPMAYRYTEAPAGIPFERRKLEEEAGPQAAGEFSRLAGDGSEEESGFVCRELAWLKQAPGCPVWPGIEVNRIDPIAPVTPEQIRNNKELLGKAGYDRMVASWNLAQVPWENLEALLEN